MSTHETKVAGIIAAAVHTNRMTGVAGTADARLMNISLGTTLGCSDLAEAIQYAIIEGADIINMSLGAAPHPLLAQTIQNALSTQGGIILVAKTGNDKTRVFQDYGPIGAHYPAWHDGVIAVGGTDANGRLWSEPGLNPIERIWLTMKARWFNFYVCKNEQQLLKRLDQAILDVINNPKKTQKTACIGTLI